MNFKGTERKKKRWRGE